MHLRRPDAEMLPSYIAALERGWSPRNVESEQARLDTLARINSGEAEFLAEFEDGETLGPPIKLPDGSEVPRLPDLVRWMWDGEFCGLINLRWQPGTSELPPHALGHVGYNVVSWKQGHGYATQALKEILPLARAQGLEWLELTATAQNIASWRVIEKAGGQHVSNLTGVIHHDPDDIVRLYRIDL